MATCTWDDVFSGETLDGKTDLQLCGIGLGAWANCYAGNPPPDTFGPVIQQIAERLGISGTPEGFKEKATAMGF